MLNKKYFDEFYVILMALICALGWLFSTSFGMISLALIATIMLYLKKDMKYVIPAVLYFIFTMSEGFSNDRFPYEIAVIVLVFVVALLIFTFKNKLSFKRMRSYKNLGLLALMNLLPIFWANNLEGYEVFYAFFFANLGYFIIYIIMANGMKSDGMKILSLSMSYLGVIMFIECLAKVISLYTPGTNIFDLWYYLGWGLCNEAGIVCCLAIPFSFYLLASTKSNTILLVNVLKIILTLLGLLLTTSRGSYLFGGLITLVCLFSTIKIVKKRKLYLSLLGLGFLGIVVVVSIYNQQFVALVKKVIDSVFSNGLDDNGRIEIWLGAFNKWQENPLYMILGPGFCAILEERASAGGVQVVPLVSHSTFYQTLLMGGIFGLICLLYHWFNSYRLVVRRGLPFFLTVGVGLFFVDLYGLIDNTYYMYYFMIPFVLILACLDSGFNEQNIK